MGDVISGKLGKLYDSSVEQIILAFCIGELMGLIIAVTFASYTSLLISVGFVTYALWKIKTFFLTGPTSLPRIGQTFTVEMILFWGFLNIVFTIVKSITSTICWIIHGGLDLVTYLVMFLKNSRIVQFSKRSIIAILKLSLRTIQNILSKIDDSDHKD